MRVAALNASGPGESKHEQSLGDTPLLSTSMKTPEFAEKDRPRSTDDDKRTRVLQRRGKWRTSAGEAGSEAQDHEKNEVTNEARKNASVGTSSAKMK